MASLHVGVVPTAIKIQRKPFVPTLSLPHYHSKDRIVWLPARLLFVLVDIKGQLTYVGHSPYCKHGIVMCTMQYMPNVTRMSIENVCRLKIPLFFFPGVDV